MVSLLLACIALEPPEIRINPDHDWDGDGQTENEGDCDDGDASIHDRAVEACDGVDADCDGLDVPSLLVPDLQPDIAGALGLAVAGDTICVAGDVEAPIVYAPVLVEVDGVTLVSSSGSAGAVLDGGGTSGPVVSIDPGDSEVVVLRGFTVQGGLGVAGAGLRIQDAQVHLDDVVVTGNACVDAEACVGTGLYATDSVLTVSGSSFRDNSAETTGDEGLIRGVGLRLERTEATLEGTEIVDNVATIDSGSAGQIDGVGLHAGGVGRLVLDEVLLGRNLGAVVGEGSTAQGGGGHVAQDLGLSRVRICGNQVGGEDAFGGGLVLDSFDEDVDLVNVIVAGNATLDAASGDGSGGGLVLNEGDGVVRLENVDVVGNQTASRGGGIYTRVDLELLNTSIAYNELLGSAGPTGDGVYCSSQTSATVALDHANTHDNSGSEAAWSDHCTLDEVELLEVEPGYLDLGGDDPCGWDLQLDEDSALLHAGAPSLQDPDGERSSVGAHGGPNGGPW